MIYLTVCPYTVIHLVSSNLHFTLNILIVKIIPCVWMFEVHNSLDSATIRKSEFTNVDVKKKISEQNGSFITYYYTA